MVMKKFLLFTICVVMAMAFAVPSHAQRLIPKQKGIEVVGSVPLIKGEKLFSKDNFGVGVSLTRYLKRENYAFALAEYEQQNMPYREYAVKLKDALLQVGYMHPILSDNGKNLFLYGGISALGGYEELNEDKKLLPDGATLLDRSCFVYGGAVHSSVELFLTDNLLLVLKAQGRLLFGSDVHRFRPALSAGLRFNL
ncbi:MULTISPECIES: conjugal transfer protein TraO [Bacteroidales]|uniref:conjugal transfer protein TraO n=1 Tax=Bacteroidales TaxID=171549 RepID=UPI0015E07299|nr:MULTISPECIES: conjugal transfer protein TraO [Bacteroidales]MDP0531664.1 conjugal transfer protein TraO [Porphyromonas gingivalis]MDP0624679.1 conjugal transfer protein TraO [Porphyromonas gingivalis]WKD51854.1 conjugal transfer protein TraO [Porphyromonas gingivalis]WKD53904.1 conjugal transfer protein TraO [Porphyromonas gingivalis]